MEVFSLQHYELEKRSAEHSLSVVMSHQHNIHLTAGGTVLQSTPAPTFTVEWFPSQQRAPLAFVLTYLDRLLSSPLKH